MSIAIRLAISPPSYPPTPSATANTTLSGLSMKCPHESSLSGRFVPTCDSSARSKACSSEGGGAGEDSIRSQLTRNSRAKENSAPEMAKGELRPHATRPWNYSPSQVAIRLAWLPGSFPYPAAWNYARSKLRHRRPRLSRARLQSAAPSRYQVLQVVQ